MRGRYSIGLISFAVLLCASPGMIAAQSSSSQATPSLDEVSKQLEAKKRARAQHAAEVKEAAARQAEAAAQAQAAAAQAQAQAEQAARETRFRDLQDKFAGRWSADVENHDENGCKSRITFYVDVRVDHGNFNATLRRQLSGACISGYNVNDIGVYWQYAGSGVLSADGWTLSFDMRRTGTNGDELPYNNHVVLRLSGSNSGVVIEEVEGQHRVGRD
jgi:hypothetical protein